MLFLIDFLKKGCELFSLFFLISFHTMCVPSLHQIWPPAPSLHWITMHFWKKKKVNKRTITISLSFLAGLYWRVWWWFRCPVFLLVCFFFFTRSSSTYTQGAADFIFQPCNSNFGHFFLFIFTFSYQLIFFPSPLVQKVLVGLTPNTSDNKCKKKKEAVSEKLTLWMYEALNSTFFFFFLTLFTRGRAS